MCKTTRGAQASGTTALIDIDPNTAPNPAPITPTFTLQQYLNKAYIEALVAHELGAQPADDSTANLRVPISLYAHVRSGSSHFYAGIHDDEMHFSASLMKVAAMYAAFSLRAEARELARAGGFANTNAFFAALGQQFNTNDAVPTIRSAGPAVGLKPKYTDILSVTGFGGGTLSIDFTDEFRNHMRQMIVPSNNASAAQCIRQLGYAYINVKLMNGRFFDRTTNTGIWLAADFAGGTRVEVDSINDGKAAQVTTSRQMARFFSGITLGTLVGSVHDEEMRQLLKDAIDVDAPWISRFGTRLYKFSGVKVGVANLKPNTPPKGPDVYSEGVLLKWKGDATKLSALNLTGDIAVCWQNLRISAFDTGVPAIAKIIETSFENFLAQAPV
jgi:hypothetical protein